jgi:hypothetical protein
MNEDIARDLDDLKFEFEHLTRFSELTEFPDAHQKCLELSDRLDNISFQSNLANNRELLFSLKKTNYTEIDGLVKDFEPYNKLWDLCHIFEDTIR